MTEFNKGPDIKKEVVEKIIHTHLDALPTDLAGFMGFEQQGRNFIVNYLPFNPPPHYMERTMSYTLGFAEEHQPYAQSALSRIMTCAARAQEMSPITGRRGELARKLRDNAKAPGHQPEAF